MECCLWKFSNHFKIPLNFSASQINLNSGDARILKIVKMQQNRIFKFPYEPYDIQTQLMNTLYDSFENGCISIVESPTGTGKSLSILCAIATWLEDFKRNEVKRLEDEISKLKLNSSTKDEDDWISNQLKQISNKQSINDINVKLDILKKHIQYTKDLKKKNRLKKYQIKKEPVTEKRNIEEVDDVDIEDNDMLIQYDDEEINLELSEDKIDDYFSPKIYYCSRTHSQLSQFINEFKKTKYFKDNETSLMMVPLSSRMNYCINCNVNRFNNLNMINEKCNDLKNSKQKCSMLNNTRLDEFREQILSNVYDLEEIVTVGKQIKACPYYSSKLAISDSEIITMPYNILLHKSTRENFGIKLKNSIVIIDEAHNLLETIYNVHSIELKLMHLLTLLKYLSLYMTKFYSKFNAQNLKYLKQLVFVCRKLSNYLENCKQNVCHNPLELSIKINIENINFHELLQFIDRSRIAIKLHMFSTTKANSTTNIRKVSKCSGTLEFLKKINANANNKNEISQQPSDAHRDNYQEEFLNSNVLYLIKDFLTALHSYNVEGKILINVDQNDKNNSSLKYILLSPSSHFKDILEECRSVVLCGGTMKPFEDYTNQLFKPLNIPKERTLFFSCNHIITDDKLVAIGCTKGPNGVSLNFSYSNRNSPETIKEIGLLLVNLVQSIPKGIVIFFPSYDYQEYLFNQWATSGIYRMLEKQKRIFKEPKKSSLVPNVLNSYTKFINSSKQASAILFSVIGGKMSEGINFSDDLGRGIIVIGLPYGNRNSPELMAKINYLNQINTNAGNVSY